MRLALLCAVAVTVSLMLGETESAFSDTSQNGASTFAAANDFCPGPTTRTVAAVADTSVWADDVNTSYGSNPTIGVNADDVGGDARVLIRFALPARAIGCDVTSARLRLYAYSSAPGRTIQVFRAADAWTEAGATWNSQPGRTGTPTSITPAFGWNSWDVTNHVNQLYAGPDHGLYLKDLTEDAPDDDAQLFHSRESAATQKPELVLTFG